MELVDCPELVLASIFQWLPLEDLCRCLRTCLTFKVVLKSDFFWEFTGRMLDWSRVKEVQIETLKGIKGMKIDDIYGFVEFHFGNKKRIPVYNSVEIAQSLVRQFGQHCIYFRFMGKVNLEWFQFPMDGSHIRSLSFIDFKMSYQNLYRLFRQTVNLRWLYLSNWKTTGEIDLEKEEPFQLQDLQEIYFDNIEKDWQLWFLKNEIKHYYRSLILCDDLSDHIEDIFHSAEKRFEIWEFALISPIKIESANFIFENFRIRTFQCSFKPYPLDRIGNIVDKNVSSLEELYIDKVNFRDFDQLLKGSHESLSIIHISRLYSILKKPYQSLFSRKFPRLTELQVSGPISSKAIYLIGDYMRNLKRLTCSPKRGSDVHKALCFVMNSCKYLERVQIDFHQVLKDPKQYGEIFYSVVSHPNVTSFSWTMDKIRFHFLDEIPQIFPNIREFSFRLTNHMETSIDSDDLIATLVQKMPNISLLELTIDHLSWTAMEDISKNLMSLKYIHIMSESGEFLHWDDKQLYQFSPMQSVKRAVIAIDEIPRLLLCLLCFPNAREIHPGQYVPETDLDLWDNSKIQALLKEYRKYFQQTDQLTFC